MSFRLFLVYIFNLFLKGIFLVLFNLVLILAHGVDLLGLLLLLRFAFFWGAYSFERSLPYKGLLLLPFSLSYLGCLGLLV
mmetsp:Transcript_43369/g.41797  ORF Transcript_43369/g.41797 Transcript_43369/m.41797 type:complete len:80 (-) Transcript_43369:702-941(-)